MQATGSGLSPRRTWLLRNERALEDRQLDDALAELLVREWPVQAVELHRFDGADFEGRLASLLVAAESEGVTCIAACGGDGTQHALASAMHRHCGRNPALAPLPYGTGNDLCRSLDRLELDALAQLESAMLHDARAVDLLVAHREDGSEDGHPEVILNAATWGSAADATGQADGDAKDEVGWLAYVAHGLSQVELRPFDVRLHLDGQLVHEGSTHFLSLGNGRTTGGGWVVAPTAYLDDGLMDLRLLGADDAMTPAILEQILRRMRGPASERDEDAATASERGEARAGTLRGKTLELAFEGDPPCNLDGERVEGPIRRVQVHPARMRIIPGGAAACFQPS